MQIPKATVSAVLSLWKRPHLLSEQMRALRHQTHAIAEFLLWEERQPIIDLPRVEGLDGRLVGDIQAGVYGRFALALLAKSEFVLVLDDDMLPAPGFVEACVEVSGTYGCAVSAGGVRFLSDEYTDNERYGWETQSACATSVDVGLNGWLLRREWISFLFRDAPPDYCNGEDIHLSWALQKYGQLSVFTPPQASAHQMASIVDIGHDSVALCERPDHAGQRSKILSDFLQRGWLTIYGSAEKRRRMQSAQAETEAHP